MGGLAAGLLLAELIVRVWFPDQAVPRADHEDDAYFCRYDPDVGWSGRPGARGSFSSTDFRTLVTLNSLGLRDDQISVAPPAGVRRILLLGDSFVWGLGVNAPEILDRRMEALLGGGAQVVNTGVSGWGTDQELLYYLGPGRRFEAREVILFLFTDNDFEDISTTLRHRHQKPIFLLEERQGRPQLLQRNVPVPPPAKEEASALARAREWVARHVYTFGFVLTRLELWERFEPLGDEIVMRWKHPDPAYTDVVMALLLDRLNSEVSRSNARLLVATVPPRRALRILGSDKRADYLDKQAFIAGVGEHSGFPVVDLLPDLEAEADAGRLPYYLHDIHWNPHGHEIAASVAVRALRSLGGASVRPGEGAPAP